MKNDQIIDNEYETCEVERDRLLGGGDVPGTTQFEWAPGVPRCWIVRQVLCYLVCRFSRDAKRTRRDAMENRPAV